MQHTGKGWGLVATDIIEPGEAVLQPSILCTAMQHTGKGWGLVATDIIEPGEAVLVSEPLIAACSTQSGQPPSPLVLLPWLQRLQASCALCLESHWKSSSIRTAAGFMGLMLVQQTMGHWGGKAPRVHPCGMKYHQNCTHLELYTVRSIRFTCQHLVIKRGIVLWYDPSKIDGPIIMWSRSSVQCAFTFDNCLDRCELHNDLKSSGLHCSQLWLHLWPTGFLPRNKF
eukprot:1145000-Pelagomonas_calceolata.AAC.1